MQLSASVNTEFDERRFARELVRALLADLDLDRLADQLSDRIADRVLARLHEAARQATGGEFGFPPDIQPGAHAAGEDYYERPEAGQ